MASINQIVSEIAQSVQGAYTVPVRRALKLAVVHARNELIRHSHSNHRYTDKVLQQRFRVTIIDVPDGDINGTKLGDVPTIKRTEQQVPRPTRLDNNLPFHSVRTAGVTNPIEIPFVKEASSKFYSHLPGICPNITYDYINDYIYINVKQDELFANLGSIIIESVFEKPELIPIETYDKGLTTISDDDEYLIPEDMVNGLKKLALETYNIQIVRQTGEVPNPNLVK
jgi:hypothetical protein